MTWNVIPQNMADSTQRIYWPNSRNNHSHSSIVCVSGSLTIHSMHHEESMYPYIQYNSLGPLLSLELIDIQLFSQRYARWNWSPRQSNTQQRIYIQYHPIPIMSYSTVLLCINPAYIYSVRVYCLIPLHISKLLRIIVYTHHCSLTGILN